MMAFESNYCVAIKHNGKTLREFTHQGSKAVLLPFDSQYELLLINNNDTLVTVEVIVDGINAFDNQKIMLEAHDRHLLKGFHRNDAMNRAFKFVKQGNDAVDLHDNPNNGIIRVIFRQAERQIKIDAKPIVFKHIEEHHHHHHHDYHYDYYWPRWQKYYHNTPIWVGTSTSQPMFSSSLSSQQDNVTCHFTNDNLSSRDINCSISSQNVEKGATVSGDVVQQTFNHVNDVVETGSQVEFGLILLGESEAGKIIKPVTVKDTKKKTCGCGNIDKFNAKFCSDCGAEYEVHQYQI